MGAEPGAAAGVVGLLRGDQNPHSGVQWGLPAPEHAKASTAGPAPKTPIEGRAPCYSAPRTRYDVGMNAAKVAVSLPRDLLAEIDRERRVSRTTRSAYFRAVLERHLEESGRAALTEAYVRGYTRQPETAAEVAAADATTAEALGELDWA